MKTKPFSIIVRMGAAQWDCRVFGKDGAQVAHKDFRTMTKRERSDFHREFMNAFRQSHNRA